MKQWERPISSAFQADTNFLSRTEHRMKREALEASEALEAMTASANVGVVARTSRRDMLPTTGETRW